MAATNPSFPSSGRDRAESGRWQEDQRDGGPDVTPTWTVAESDPPGPERTPAGAAGEQNKQTHIHELSCHQPITAISCPLTVLTSCRCSHSVYISFNPPCRLSTHTWEVAGTGWRSFCFNRKWIYLKRCAGNPVSLTFRHHKSQTADMSP